MPEDVAAAAVEADGAEKAPTPESIRRRMVSVLFNSLENGGEEAEKDRDNAVREYLLSVIAQHPDIADYNILILHDEGRMMKSDADNIYAAVTGFNDKKKLLLVLYSSGGYSDAAYLIGKLCRDHSNGCFVVSVPRQAKSAATLLCCAADEIHMGSLSELGPIDPQIDGLPALGLKNSVEHIAELVKDRPASSDMFAKYLNLSLNLIHLGYYERVAESAKQYAERLLKPHRKSLASAPDKIAHDLVYGYKDHGFVIDKGEAETIFGKKTVQTNTVEYEFGNAIYQAMKFLSAVAGIFNYTFYFIGSPDSKPTFTKRTTARSQSPA